MREGLSVVLLAWCHQHRPPTSGDPHDPIIHQEPGLPSSHHEILKNSNSRLDRWQIQGRKKTAECGAMWKHLSTEEGHKGGRKRSESLIKGEQRSLPTHHISDEHRDKINHVIHA